MQVTIERDGRKETVQVAPDFSSVELGGRSFPVSVLASSAMRVELEIAGDRVVVDQWPEHAPQPPGPVDVSGERWKVDVVAGPSASTRETAAPSKSLSPQPPAAREPPPGPGTGLAILPPMPGRVIEVRVKEGQAVHKDDVLLVLEAMKMRNEITSPADGFVRGLRVVVGTNARAKEAMLFVAATSGP